MTSATSDLRQLGSTSANRPGTTVAAPPTHWKTRILLPGVILLIIVGLVVVTSAQTFLPATPVRVVPVIVKTVEGSVGSVTVQAPGWLEPDPHPYYVAALADGIVESILVLEGDQVEAGQVVARLVDDDARLALQRAEAELQRRHAEQLAARANLDAARLELEHLIDRSRVLEVADAAVAEARAELDKVNADIGVEQARLSEVRDEYERKAMLEASQAVSEATVARLRLRVDGQEAQVRAAVAKQAIHEAKLRRAQADLRAATTQRELLIDERRAVALAEAAMQNAVAAVALAQAARDQAALTLDRMQVRTPVAGIVLQRLASPGSMLSRGLEHSLHVMHIYKPEKMQVRVDVPLADAAQVVVGQNAEIIVEVLPDRTFSGTVTRTVHQADIQKNTVEVKVAVNNPTPELKPEMLARVRFTATQSGGDSSVRQRVFAPRVLINTAPDGDTALVVAGVVDGVGRVERRSVTTGRKTIDDWTEIESGLRVGDLLVADPTGTLEPGARVRIVGELPTERGG